MKKICSSLLFSTLLLVWGCQTSFDRTAELYVGIEKEFALELREDLRPTGNVLAFYMETFENQPCSDVRIEYDLVKKDREIRLQIQQLSFPEPCEGMEAPATLSAPLGGLDEGLYSVSFNLQSTIESVGFLEVFSDRFILDIPVQNGIQLVANELMRIPDELVWGYVAYDFPEQESSGASFLSEIGAFFEPIACEDGNYGYFEIRNEELYLLEAVEGLENVVTFYGKVNGSIGTIIPLVEQYREENKEHFEIRLFTWDGTKI